MYRISNNKFFNLKIKNKTTFKILILFTHLNQFTQNNLKAPTIDRF